MCWCVSCVFVFVSVQSARPDWLWSGVGFRLDDRVYREDRVTQFLRQQWVFPRHLLTGSASPFSWPPSPPSLFGYTLPSPLSSFSSPLSSSFSHHLFLFLLFLSAFCCFYTLTSSVELLHSSLSSCDFWPSCHWVQYELAEQVETTGFWESVWSRCRPLQPLHCWPRDLSHGVWKPLETGELKTHLFSWFFDKRAWFTVIMSL